MADKEETIKRYWKVDELAKLFGYTDVRSIYHLTENGNIKTVDVKENGHRVKRFDLLPTITAAVTHYREKASGREHRDTETELKNQKLKAEIALKESQGELHKLRTEIAQGQYMPIDEVKLDYAKFFTVFKNFVSDIPARLISILAGTIEPVEARRLETMMNNEVQNQLRDFVLAARTPDKEPEEEPEKKQKPESGTKKAAVGKEAKSIPAKKTAVKKSTAVKASVGKSTESKTTAKKNTAEKETAEKGATAKASAGKSTVVKPAARKSTTAKTTVKKNTPAKASAGKSTTAKSATGKGATAKATAGKASTGKSTAVKAVAKKTAARKAADKKSTTGKTAKKK